MLNPPGGVVAEQEMIRPAPSSAHLVTDQPPPLTTYKLLPEIDRSYGWFKLKPPVEGVATAQERN